MVGVLLSQGHTPSQTHGHNMGGCLDEQSSKQHGPATSNTSPLALLKLQRGQARQAGQWGEPGGGTAEQLHAKVQQVRQGSHLR